MSLISRKDLHLVDDAGVYTGGETPSELEAEEPSSVIEKWRPVVDYEGFYSVSNHGRVRSEARTVAFPHATFGASTRRLPQRILKPSVLDTGYLGLALCRDNVAKTRSVHSLVASAFLGPCPEGEEVRHIDGDRLNSSLDNLRYGTRSENQMDAVRHGTHSSTRKTLCKRNHALTGANLRVTPVGYRVCKSCDLSRQTIKRAARAGLPLPDFDELTVKYYESFLEADEQEKRQLREQRDYLLGVLIDRHVTDAADRFGGVNNLTSEQARVLRLEARRLWTGYARTPDGANARTTELRRLGRGDRP